MSRNEAAERLLDALDEDVAEYVDGPETTERALEIRKKSLDRIDAALATERRLTVERLRQGLEAIRDTSTDPASRQLAESMLADLATADVDEEAGK